jgi:hypothetical protein
MTALNTDDTITRSRRAFALHFAEMLLAMLAGMGVLGGALALAGTSMHDWSAAAAAAAMAIAMTAPMVWWMRFRGHPARHGAEMAGSMIVPSAMAIGLHWLGLLPAGAVLAVQHVVMVPAMLGVMLWRYDHYAHP